MTRARDLADLISSGKVEASEIATGTITSANIQTATLDTLGKTEFYGFKYVDTNGDGSANATSYAADSNTPVLDEDIITLGVIWRFLKQKGLPYDNQFQEYRLKLSEKQSKDGAKQIIRMAGPNRLYLPVNEPEGNFSL